MKKIIYTTPHSGDVSMLQQTLKQSYLMTICHLHILYNVEWTILYLLNEVIKWPREVTEQRFGDSYGFYKRCILVSPFRLRKLKTTTQPTKILTCGPPEHVTVLPLLHAHNLIHIWAEIKIKSPLLLGNFSGTCVWRVRIKAMALFLLPRKIMDAFKITFTTEKQILTTQTI